MTEKTICADCGEAIVPPYQVEWSSADSKPRHKGGCPKKRAPDPNDSRSAHRP